MALEEKKDKPEFFYYRLCPNCKTKVHTERKYCKCLFDLSRTPITVADNEPNILPLVNIETSEINCEKCGLGCTRCYSFSVDKKNDLGFGGKDCEHWQNHIRCTCCQTLLKKKNFFETIKFIFELSQKRAGGKAA